YAPALPTAGNWLRWYRSRRRFRRSRNRTLRAAKMPHARPAINFPANAQTRARAIPPSPPAAFPADRSAVRVPTGRRRFRAYDKQPSTRPARAAPLPSSARPWATGSPRRAPIASAATPPAPGLRHRHAYPACGKRARTAAGATPQTGDRVPSGGFHLPPLYHGGGAQRAGYGGVGQHALGTDPISGQCNAVDARGVDIRTSVWGGDRVRDGQAGQKAYDVGMLTPSGHRQVGESFQFDLRIRVVVGVGQILCNVYGAGRVLREIQRTVQPQSESRRAFRQRPYSELERRCPHGAQHWKPATRYLLDRTRGHRENHSGGVESFQAFDQLTGPDLNA